MTPQEAMMAGFQHEITKHAEDIEVILEILEKNAGLLSGSKKLLKSVGQAAEKKIFSLGKRTKPISTGIKSGVSIGTHKVVKTPAKQMGWESSKLLRRMDKAGM